jgi:hypothetical protein
VRDRIALDGLLTDGRQLLHLLVRAMQIPVALRLVEEVELARNDTHWLKLLQYIDWDDLVVGLSW